MAPFVETVSLSSDGEENEDVKQWTAMAEMYERGVLDGDGIERVRESDSVEEEDGEPQADEGAVQLTGGGVGADAHMCNVLIKAYARAGRQDAALRVVRRMRANGVPPSLVTYNTLMAMFAREARSREAEATLKQVGES